MPESIPAASTAGDLPEGFIYRPDFLSETDEQELLTDVRRVQFSELRMRDKVARRGVAHFGWLYDYDSWKIEPGPAIPEFLHGLRERAAALVAVEAEELVETLMTEYPPEAAIGWHRDAPAFDIVVAISLLSP
jgi:alkylated DNA repair protein (DNA oxidative demethylase)